MRSLLREITAFGFATLLLVSTATAQTVRMQQYRHPKEETDRAFNKLYLAGARMGNCL